MLAHFKNNFPNAKGKIEIILCDLSSLESVVEACNKVKSKLNSLDVLINNAGLWNFSYRESKNGIEETFQVNVLAPLLINHLLIDLLAKSREAKTIFTASALHQGNVNFSDLEFKKKFSGFSAYRQSKLEVILLCRLLSSKLEKAGIGVYCHHPGLVNTKLGRDAGWFSNLFFKLMGISPQKGAETMLYLSTENKNHLVSGEYYYRKAVKKITPQSYDLNTAQKLLDTLGSFLLKYIDKPSLIFPDK